VMVTLGMLLVVMTDYVRRGVLCQCIGVDLMLVVECNRMKVRMVEFR
jgi:hypothetical protein